MRIILIVLMAATALSACSGKRGERASRGGVELPFKARLDRQGADHRAFTVAVIHQGAELDALRESVRYPATRYCIYNYGGSDVVWQSDPSTGEWVSTLNGDRRVFSGRCEARN